MTLAANDESRRLAMLHRMSVLDTAPDPAIDGIAKAAARVCGTPMALVSLVDENRQWFKANYGLDGITETPRGIAFCDHAIRDDGLFVVEDAASDDRFKGNPLVTGELGLRFYAGAPLVTASGERLGALCVIDKIPRQLAPAQREALERLADVVVELLLEHAARSVPPTLDSADSGDTSTAAERILNHAKTVLVTNGASGFSMRKVAKAAEISLGHLQHYFPTKVALVHAIVDSMRSSFLRYYQLSIQPIPNPVDRFVACAEHILDQGPDARMILLLRECWSMATRDTGIAATLSDFYQDCRRLAARILREANPELERDEARLRACTAVSLLSGAFLYLTPWAGTNNPAGFRDYILAAIVHLPFESTTTTPAAC